MGSCLHHEAILFGVRCEVAARSPAAAGRGRAAARLARLFQFLAALVESKCAS